MELYLTEKTAVLNAALPHIPFDGWGEDTLKRAANEAGLNPEMVALWFPCGALDVIIFQHQQADAQMVEAIATLPLATMRVPQKIKEAVMIRLRQQQQNRAAIRRAMGIISLPIHAAEATKLLYGTVDAIWYAIGDTSTDFNFYTKRMTLAAVYSATILCWLGDETPYLSETSEFLDRRLKNVHSLGQTTKKCREFLTGWMPKKFG
jgi:ubiquinone biosynthesis protein COQ9